MGEEEKQQIANKKKLAPKTIATTTTANSVSIIFVCISYLTVSLWLGVCMYVYVFELVCVRLTRLKYELQI